MSDLSQREYRIRERAHSLWDRAGRPDGKDDEFWTEAEQQIAAEERPPAEGDDVDHSGTRSKLR